MFEGSGGAVERWLAVIENLLSSLSNLPDSDILIGLLLFAGTAVLIALWVPGVLLPIAASSGALLDATSGATVVAGGALVGSMVIFATTRRFGADRIPPRIAEFLARFEARFKSRGAWFVIVSRLVGAPHFLTSAGYAMMPIRAPAFALATLLGSAPAIVAAAIAGSSLT